MTAPAADTASTPPENATRLFIISVLALVTAGMAFSLRTGIANDLKTNFLDPIDSANSAAMLGSVLGISFLGFAFTIAIASPLLDVIGMGRLLVLSALCFISGGALIETTPHTVAAYNWLYVGCLLSGMAWGLVETVVNPLIATLYAKDKTTKLNHLHAWWPAGLVIGGVIGQAIGEAGIGWQGKYAALFAPAAIFGLLALLTPFPRSERAAAGVSGTAMFAQLPRPLFIIFFCCMFLTAAAELAPGQWVDFALSRTVGMRGIWLQVYVSCLMFAMRNFAGTLAHRLSPVGVLWSSCLIAAVGLVALAKADSPVTGLLAATIWGTGVCFLWPTMLAAASERFPKGGALLMGLMGTAGTTSIWFFLPRMGAIYDTVKLALANGQDPGQPVALMLAAIRDGVLAILASVHLASPPVPTNADPAAFNALTAAAANDPAAAAKLDGILAAAAQMSFEAMAVLPAALLVVFGAIWIYDRMRGGYKPEKI